MAIPGSAPSSTGAEERGRLGFPLTYVAGCLLTGAVAGVLAGWLWTRLASPAIGILTSNGVALGETALNQEVGATMWFLTTSASVGLLVGLLLAWRSSRQGVTAVLAVVAACCVGSLVSYWTGVHLFGPDAKAQLASARPGEHIAVPLSVGTKIAFVGWPVGGLFGVLVAISRWPRISERPSATRSTGGARPVGDGSPSEVTRVGPTETGASGAGHPVNRVKEV